MFLFILQIPKAEVCTSGNGTYECGKCTCNPGRYGEFCECEETDNLDVCIA